MFAKILRKMQRSISNDETGNKRVHPRRRMDNCVGVVNGKTFPVEDWSVGGVLLQGDDRLFGMNDTADITLKFRLKGDIMTVTHTGTIIRKTKDKFAIQFAPLTRDISNRFQQVISDYAAHSA